MLTPSDWVGIAGVLLTLGLAGGLLWRAQARYRLHPELVRKLLHVVMGGATLSFPWLFDGPWPVVGLALGTTGLLIAVRQVKKLRAGVGGVIHGVARRSYGELCFPPAVCAVFALSGGDPVLYGIPILLLTLADPAAALVGMRYGRRPYRTADGAKSREGSLAFFAVAFCCTLVPLVGFTGVGRLESVLLAGLVGFLAMMVEAASWRGLDNLFVPVGGFLLLQTHLFLPISVLTVRLVVLAVLFAAAVSWQRVTTLDGSAVMGAAVIGFVTWVVGGWAWLLAPAVCYFGYALLWPEAKAEGAHTVYHVLSVASVGGGWLFLAAALEQPRLLFPYTLAYATALALIGVERLKTSPRLCSALRLWSSSALKSCTALLLPYLAVQEGNLDVLLYGTCFLGAVGGAVFVFGRYTWFFHDHPYESMARLYRASLIAAASSIGLLALIHGS